MHGLPQPSRRQNIHVPRLGDEPPAQVLRVTHGHRDPELVRRYRLADPVTSQWRFLDMRKHWAITAKLEADGLIGQELAHGPGLDVVIEIKVLAPLHWRLHQHRLCGWMQHELANTIPAIDPADEIDIRVTQDQAVGVDADGAGAPGSSAPPRSGAGDAAGRAGEVRE